MILELCKPDVYSQLSGSVHFGFVEASVDRPLPDSENLRNQAVLEKPSWRQTGYKRQVQTTALPEVSG